MKKKPLLLKSYVLLAALESAFSFYYLVSISSDAGSAIFVGYSASRLLLLGGAVIPLLVFGYFLAAISIFPDWLNQGISLIDDFLREEWKRIAVVVVSSLLAFAGGIFLLTPSTGFGDFATFAERLAPLVYLSGLLGAQTLLGLFLWREQKVYFQNLLQWKSIFAIAGILLALAALTAVWVAWSGIGLKPETYGWHRPGTPIPFAQLLIALFVSLLFVFLRSRIKDSSLWKIGKLPLKFETVIFLVLWIAAFLIWQGEPMRRQSYFTPTPTAPNFEYYPFSDAGFYDTTSQSILIGEGRKLDVILRPLYVFFLAILHLIGGQDYAVVLTLQTLALALMPALVFLLVSRMGSQSAGFLSAILLIFREKNSIALTNILEVSHSKLLLSDLPTMAFMLLLVYTLVNWLRKANNDHLLGIISGASFGLVVLVRSQAQLLIPILLAGIVFSGGSLREWRKAIQRFLIFTLGLFIVITPWVWRNYQVSGKPAVENTGFYIRLFAGGYAEPTDVVDQLLGETLDEYNSRIKSQMIRYVVNHPVEIAGIYATYFVHNEIISVVYLPMSLKLYDPRSYVDHLPFWDDPYIDLANGYGVMFFFTLGLISLGVGLAVKRLNFLGALPLLIHFTYSLSVVTARISGWRFVLPVDWILLVYYCMGLIQLVVMIASVFLNRNLAVEDANNDPQNEPVRSSFFQGKTFFAMAGFLLIGLSLPMLELVMPVRYPALSQSELIEIYVADAIQMDGGEQVTASALKKFVETEPAATVMYGRALYPSYYKQGRSWGDSNPTLLAASQFSRLQFTLVGSVGTFAFIPLEDAPQYFPHASDVFIVGCKQNGFIRALIIKVNGRLVTSSPWGGLTCSATE